MKKFLFAVAMMTAFATTTVFANTTAVESTTTTQQVKGSTQYSDPFFSEMVSEMFGRNRAFTPDEIDMMASFQANFNLSMYYLNAFGIYTRKYGDTPENQEVYDFLENIRKVLANDDTAGIKDMLREWYYLSLGC